MNIPKLILKKDFASDNYSVWIGERRDSIFYVAKPVGFVLEELKEGLMYPEPTFRIPRMMIKEWYEQMTEHLTQEKEPFLFNHDAIKAKDENLKDLRLVVDKLFMKMP